MRRFLAAILLAVLAVLVGRALLDNGSESSSLSGRTVDARVVKVVDGDTIRVRLDGRTERVRYIGVDTPESVKPGTPVQCFAKAASAYNRRLVAGQVVRLDFDVEQRDRYGRLLAYVHRGKLFVNAELARLGYATPLTIPPNVRYARRFVSLARAARQAGRGLWSTCEG